MICKSWGCSMDVIETRSPKTLEYKRRRYKCKSCGERITTVEVDLSEYRTMQDLKNLIRGTTTSLECLLYSIKHIQGELK